MTTQTLDRELRTYEAHRDELLGSAEGKWVLIHGDDVEGIFEDRLDAIRRGSERFGHVPFLTKRIERYETRPRFTHLRLRD